MFDITIEQSSSYSYVPRTEHNANKADATIAIAVDFSTAGERLTSRIAGAAYLPIPFPWESERAANHIFRHLYLRKARHINIAGNGIYTLHKHDLTQEDANQRVYNMLKLVISRCRASGIAIQFIRSGGQTGIDTAGLVAGIALGIPVIAHMPKNNRQRNEAGEEIHPTTSELRDQWIAWAYELNPDLCCNEKEQRHPSCRCFKD